MMGFGVPQFVDERFAWAYEECKNHIGCAECRFVNRKAITIGEGQEQTSVVCETGINKCEVES